MAFSLRRNFVDTRIFAALSVLALFAIVSTIVSIIAVERMVAARQVGVIDSTIRLDLANMLDRLTAAESAQRGYILTGDQSFFTTYNEAKNQVPTMVATLQKNSKNTDYEDEVANLVPLVQDRIERLGVAIAAYQAEGQAGGSAAIATGRGQSIMNELRANIADVTGELNADIAGTRKTVDVNARLARNIGLLSLLGTIVVLVGIYFLFDHALEAERRLDRAKDEFVALASHQLRTPATGIKSILSMLASGDFGELNKTQKSVIDKAVMSNQRELAIIEELLNVAKADAGRLVLNPAQLNLNALIEQITAEQKSAIAVKHLKLNLKLPTEPVILNGDEEKLYMAITNLIDNARKYTPDGGTITVSLTSHRGQVNLEVTDNGIGIEEAELNHIFDRFQRSRLVLAGTIEGTGLGLYLARYVAELHHGTINVDSKKGHGSRFTMVLPRQTTS